MESERAEAREAEPAAAAAVAAYRPPQGIPAGAPLARRVLALQRAAGNRATTRLLQRDLLEDLGAAVGVKAQQVTREWGTFWLWPPGRPAGKKGDEITTWGLAFADAAWARITAGTGRLLIEEDGTQGFRDRTLNQLKKLMSKPTGRELVSWLTLAAHPITVRPRTSANREIGEAKPSNDFEASPHAPKGVPNNSDIPLPDLPGAGSPVTIFMDPTMGDKDVVFEDAKHKGIAAPTAIILGHELIHAAHMVAGIRDQGKTQDPKVWQNDEEYNTIANSVAGLPTENMLRAEHGLPARASHAHHDLRKAPPGWRRAAPGQLTFEH